MSGESKSGKLPDHRLGAELFQNEAANRVPDYPASSGRWVRTRGLWSRLFLHSVLIFGFFQVLACYFLASGNRMLPTQAPEITMLATTSATPVLTDTPSALCEAVTTSDAIIYTRPDASAEVFSTVPAGFTQQIDAQTASGWRGFDPGIAQAANIGPFRLRWFEPGEVNLAGACEGLPVVWAPPPGVCFDMPMEEVEVHADSHSYSTVIVILGEEEFAAVLGISSNGWAKVDLGPGNTGLSLQGWIELSTINLNGPCDDLPVLKE